MCIIAALSSFINGQLQQLQKEVHGLISNNTDNKAGYP